MRFNPRTQALATLGIAVLLGGCTSNLRSSDLAAQAPIASVADLGEPVSQGLDLAKKGRVLAIFDIDNTLLTTPQDLGGDAWFNLRAAQAKDDAQFEALFKDGRFIQSVARMTPTQPDMARQIQRLQQAGIPVIAMTARGSELYGATMNALSANGVALNAGLRCRAPLCTQPGAVEPEMTAKAALRLRLRGDAALTRSLVFQNGLAMTAGQNKGTMLKLLLGSLPDHYDHILFVDDSKRNVTDVARASVGIAPTLHIWHYDRLDAQVAAYKADPARQEAARTGFERIRAAICAALSSDICPSEATPKP